MPRRFCVTIRKNRTITIPVQMRRELGIGIGDAVVLVCGTSGIEVRCHSGDEIGRPIELKRSDSRTDHTPALPPKR